MQSIARVRRSVQDARRAYNRLSRWYDALANASEGPLRDRGLQVLAAQPGERVLEIGFGTGHALVSLAQAVAPLDCAAAPLDFTAAPSGYVVGVDISDGMAAVAGQRLTKAGCAERVALALADGARLPFAAGSFDAAFISFTLELFDTPLLPSVLASCRENLKPAGRLCVVALAKDLSGDALPARLYELAHRRLPRWVDCRPIFVGPLLQAHGFCIVASIRHAMWGLPVDVVLARKSEGGLVNGAEFIP
ncbi:MAG: methyltransferase domain-containing protein [Anaerolineae bacterium]|nr:methyltransferase domain-containing protein [Anaerolineae bacterium]